MTKRLHILVAEPSQMIRSGLMAMLRKLSNIPMELAQVWDIQDLVQQLVRYRPDVLVVNPAELGLMSVDRLREDSGLENLQVVALLHTQLPGSQLLRYDETLSIYDSTEVLRGKLLTLSKKNGQEEGAANTRQKLTAREQEIVVGVVKGMTNKQIADQLFLSAHTVMTHRKNIAAKLQIHSPAGLTIYAIVNKLVDIEDIKNT